MHQSFHTGAVESHLQVHYSSTVSVGSIHVSVHLPILILIDNLHSRQQVCAVDNLAHEPYQHTGIHGAFQGIYESRKQVCDKRWSMIHTYTPTITPHARPLS